MRDDEIMEPGDLTGRPPRFGGPLCAAIASGTPMHIDILGSGSLDQAGAVIGIVAVLGLAAMWLWKLTQQSSPARPTVAPGVAEAMWDEFTATADTSTEVASDDHEVLVDTR